MDASLGTPDVSTEDEEVRTAKNYLADLINRTLHVYITDGRMFVGQLKCTDRERNIILAMTHEYREPSQNQINQAADLHAMSGGSRNVRVDMLKRFVGLIVIPGQYITKIELEQFT